MAGFMDKVRKERERRDKAVERAMDRGLRQGKAPAKLAASRKRGPVKHQMEKVQNKPTTITSGQAERERKQREIARKIRELEGK